MRNLTIKEFNKLYPNDDACLESIFQSRYGNSNCPNCKLQGKFHKIKDRKRYDCQCGHQVHPLAGTIFHKSSTSLVDWFTGIYEFSTSRNGMSALELQRKIGVTYKTAWRMARQIRLLLDESGIKLSDDVEADETYIGGKRKGKRGRGADGKSVVFGMKQRKGSVKAQVVANVKGKTLVPIIEDSVEKGSRILTDELPSYRKLPTKGFKHETVNHGAKEYARGDVHVNNTEGFWSQVKRSIDGTYHAVSKKHLQHYVNEFSWRLNHRGEPMFDSMLKLASMPLR